MKTILGIIGSPRKDGNTNMLVSKILEGSKSIGNKSDSLYLGNLTINECIGCHACWRGLDCSRNDDMNYLFSRITNADVLIFGTPVYWYGPTALIKAFLDRFVYFNCPENRTKIRGKRAILVVPFEEDNYETAEPLIRMFEKSFKYLEMNLIERIIVPGVGEKRDVLKKPDILEKCLNLGKSLV